MVWSVHQILFSNSYIVDSVENIHFINSKSTKNLAYVYLIVNYVADALYKSSLPVGVRILTDFNLKIIF